MRVGLAVGAERGGAPRCDRRILGHDVLVPGRFGVMDDVGRIGGGGQERLQDLGVEPAAARDRHARSDRMARDLVTEAHVCGTDLEQPAALELLGGAGPLRHDGVEQPRADLVRHDGRDLDETPRRVAEPRGPAQHRVGDRRRQAVLRTRGEQLGDIERVAARDRVQLVSVLAGQRRDGEWRERGELDVRRRAGAGGPERDVQRVAGPAPRRRGR